jgi:hypothetical protein
MYKNKIIVGAILLLLIMAVSCRTYTSEEDAAESSDLDAREEIFNQLLRRVFEQSAIYSFLH